MIDPETDAEIVTDFDMTETTCLRRRSLGEAERRSLTSSPRGIPGSVSTTMTDEVVAKRRPVLQVVIQHRGVDGKAVTHQQRAVFAKMIETETKAAAALARWPHYTGEWGPTIVTSAFVTIKIWNTDRIGPATIDALLNKLGRCAFTPLAARDCTTSQEHDDGPIRLEVSIDARMIEVVENPVDRAVRNAREHIPEHLVHAEDVEVVRDENGRIVNASAGQNDELRAIETPEHVVEPRAVRMPPVDPLDDFLDRLARPGPNLNAVTATMLLSPSRSSGATRGAGGPKRRRKRKPYVGKRALLPDDERCVSRETLRITGLAPECAAFWHNRTGRARAVLRAFVEQRLFLHSNAMQSEHVKEVIGAAGAPAAKVRDFVLYGLPEHVISALKLWPGVARAILAAREEH